MKEIGTIDGGIIFTGKRHTYLVIYIIDGEAYAHLETGSQICDKMDMDDCYDIRVANIWLIYGTELKECQFNGTWHDLKNPLRMTITDKATGKEYDVFYGTDH